jgi:cobalt-zinc-cadmium efflux system outer membrane protein
MSCLFPLFFILLIFSGCSKKVSVQHSFSKLAEQTKARTDELISMQTGTHRDMGTTLINTRLEQQQLTSDEAIGLALRNNPGLRADFENLGIANADLVQAGLYTNPTVNSVFRFPTRDQGPGTGQTNIETIASFRLSDLWQVPLSKNVSADILEIVSLRILDNILSLIANTKISYARCLTAQKKLAIYKLLIEEYVNLKDEIYYRQLYGYSNDLDKYYVDIQLEVIKASYISAQAEVYNAFFELKKLIGIESASESLYLSQELEPIAMVPQIEVLEESARNDHPKLLISRVKIKQYGDTISLEKAKTLRQVDLGLGYKQDFDAPFRGWGPYLNISLPFFDTNHAQRTRAEFLLNQAKYDSQQAELEVLNEVRTYYTLVGSLMNNISHYNEIISSNKKAIEYTYNYARTMQINMLTALESSIRKSESELKLAELHYDLNKYHAMLERAVGKKLNMLVDYGKNVLKQ